MKKLIPILSLAVLSSCTNTTPLEAGLAIPHAHIFSSKTKEHHIATKSTASKKIAATTSSQPHTRKISGKLAGGKHGVASWYGGDFHGRKTANGELFDMYAMTAAHNSLPIPSYAEITNVENKRTVIVRINDRGPFYDHRVISFLYPQAVFHHIGCK